jgi:hypothetical protein
MGFWGDVGDAISDTASTVGNVAEGAVDSVVDTVRDGIDTGIGWAQDRKHSWWIFGWVTESTS